MTTPRERARAKTITEITALGREHLVRYGAAGLSLRAVARDLGVVSSAIYRYVPSRDDLLTLLIVDAYEDLGDAVTQAVTAVDPADYRARWRTLAGAVRDWALANPARYGLIYGAPVPGYQAPADQTIQPGTRVIALLLTLARDAEHAGARPALSDTRVPAAVHADAEKVRSAFELDVSAAMLVAGVLAWVGLFGAVSFEVFGQYGADTFAAPDLLFASLIDLLADLLGLPQGSPQSYAPVS